MRLYPKNKEKKPRITTVTIFKLINVEEMMELENHHLNQVWWCTSIIPALRRRLRQEDGDLRPAWATIVRPYQKKKKERKKGGKKGRKEGREKERKERECKEGEEEEKNHHLTTI
jgi:hypothetical protein